MSQERKEAGSVKIIEMSLDTPSGKASLTQIATRVDVYESILSPYLVCEIGIVDGIGLRGSFTQATEMTVTVKFTSDENFAPFEHVFSVWDVVDTNSATGDKAKTYKFVCVSEDFDKVDAREFIQYPYNNTCAFLIADLLQNKIKTKKEGYFEQTDGILPASSISNKTPFQLIDFFRLQALSPTYQSHSFVFYQDKYGYKFTTIEKLIEDGKKKIGDRVFTFDAVSVQKIDSSKSNWRNILLLDNLVENSSKWEEYLGGNNPRAVVCNLDQMSFDQIQNGEYNFVRMDDSGSAPKTNARVDKAKDKFTENLFFIQDDDDDPVPAKKTLALRKFIPELLSVVSHAQIYGDSTLTVGEMIKIQMPEINGLTDRKTELSANHSGNYMITKLRHIIDMSISPPLYTQALEVCKSGGTR